jgi:predicted molibdopterin-dependent oxidoreductase YjgC
MGFYKEFPYTSPEEVFEEWKGITCGRICDMSGVSYGRLRNKIGPQLPCPEADHPGTPRLFTDLQFPRPDGRAALLARDYKEPAETTNDEYPFVLITGRLACHFNTGTRTGRIKRLNDIESNNFVEIHPNDATLLEIAEGDEIEVTSRRGSVRGVARIKDRVLTGNVFMSIHYGKAFLLVDGKLANLVCNPVYDVHSKQPEFKYCAVRVAKVASCE